MLRKAKTRRKNARKYSPMPKRIKVTVASESGRNLAFHDNFTGQNLTRAQFVRAIEAGEYTNYHVRVVDGIKTPAGNPDGSVNNNLG
jgi:hypothetical protein